MNFDLNMTALDSCQPAICKEEARYYLNGVHLYESHGKAVYEATDAHMMVRITTDDDAPGGLNIVIPRYLVEFLLTGIVRDIANDGVKASFDGVLNLIMGELTMTAKMVDGTFPDISGIIEKCLEHKIHEAGRDVGFNIKLLCRIHESLDRFTNTQGAKIRVFDQHGPAYFHATHRGIGKWEALLMPLAGVGLE